MHKPFMHGPFINTEYSNLDYLIPKLVQISGNVWDFTRSATATFPISHVRSHCPHMFAHGPK